MICVAPRVEKIGKINDEKGEFFFFSMLKKYILVFFC